jgi:hypothetical protein
VQGAAKAVRDRYIFPDVGEQAAKAIESALASGRYDAIGEPSALADRLTTDVQAVAHDKHLRVSALPPMAEPGSAGAPPPLPPSEAGVTRADRLADNIGYLKIVGFPPSAVFKAPLDRAMASLADTRALVIDIRRHDGGDPKAVNYFLSYFVAGKEPVHLGDLVTRVPGTQTFTTEASWTSKAPISFAGKPVYVLISSETASGGEAFASAMQAMKLGTLVGGTTWGGAHPGAETLIGPGILIFVPDTRGSNTITGPDWEGVGVKPDIAVAGGEALKVALEKLGQTSPAAEIEALSQARLFTPRATPQPGSESALRRMIDGIQQGDPSWDLLTESYAKVMRGQYSPAARDLFVKMGAIQGVTFVAVDGGPLGGDVYDVKLTNGSARCVVALTPDGKIANLMLRPMGPPGAGPGGR